MSENECEIRETPLTLSVRLRMASYGIKATEALNCDKKVNTVTSADIAVQLRRAINRLKAEHINTETGRVNYAALAKSDAFQEYVAAARALQNFNPWRLNDERERMAFWINLYNTLMIHAVITYGIRESVNEVRGMFDRAAYIIGGYRMSANDIEHGVLRANVGHPVFPGEQFMPLDPRRAFCMSKIDARVHFALVCAAKSCPPIAFYDADYLQLQLDKAAQNFINNGGVEIDHAKKTVVLSRIFSWYASDFGAGLLGYSKQVRLLHYAAKYIESEREAQFIKNNADKLKVRFMAYDWKLNV